MDHTLSLFERTPHTNSESTHRLLKESEAKGSQLCPRDPQGNSSKALMEARLLPAIELAAITAATSTGAAIASALILPGGDLIAVGVGAAAVSAISASGAADFYCHHRNEMNNGAKLAGEVALGVVLGPSAAGLAAGEVARAGMSALNGHH